MTAIFLDRGFQPLPPSLARESVYLGKVVTGVWMGFEVLQISQSIRNGFKGSIRFRQDSQQVLAGNRPVGGMHQLPPPLYRFLYLTLGFGVLHEAVDEPIDLALYRLIRYRDFLPHISRIAPCITLLHGDGQTPALICGHL